MITGASGFLGKKLCETLSQKNIKFIPVTRTSFGNIKKNLDLRNNIDWAEYLINVNTIVHVAAKVHITSKKKSVSLEEYKKINNFGTLNLARQAAACGVKRFIFISTAKVSGELSIINNPFNEEELPDPKDSYSISKLETENELLELSKTSSLEIVIIRPPLIYGPGVGANFLAMINWINKGLPLPIKGIKNLRSLVYIYNLIDFILLCITHDLAKNEIFFVSDDDDISTIDLIKKIAYEMNKKIYFLYFPDRLLSLLAKVLRKENEISRLKNSLQIDISKAKKILDWKPNYNINVAIKETILSYKKNLVE
jgi:nucleoside-diphosphate-sugar epimerase